MAVGVGRLEENIIMNEQTTFTVYVLAVKRRPKRVEAQTKRTKGTERKWL